MRISFKKTAGYILVGVVFLAINIVTVFAVSKDKDKDAPIISDVSVSSVSMDSATITWITDEPADSDIDYGIAPALNLRGPASADLVTTHTITLSGLVANSTYSFCVISYDESKNKARDCGHSFTTNNLPPLDQTPPVIYNIGVSAFTIPSAVITWTTDEIANAQVEYGTTESYGYLTPLNETLDINHAVTLDGLIIATTYHFRILARDGSGNMAMSADGSFYTSANLGGGNVSLPSTPSPESGLVDSAITDVSVNRIRTTTAVVEWKTGKPSTSQVDYGLTSAYGNSTEKDLKMVTTHQQAIKGLTAGVEYHFRVASSDNTGNTSYSIDAVFKTSDGSPDKTPPVPIDDLAITDLEETSLTLSWTTPEDETGVIFYDVNRSSAVLDESNFHDDKVIHETVITAENLEEHGNSHLYRVIGLTPGEKAYFAIKAQDPFKNISQISNVVSVDLPLTEGIVDQQPPGKVSFVQAAGLDKLIFFAWKNPTDKDFARVHIMRSATGYPSHPDMGETIYEGRGTTFSDPNLNNSQTYYYSIFTYDEAKNYSKPIQLSLAPYAERRHHHVLSVSPQDDKKASGVSITKDVAFGDSGDEVSHLQEILATNVEIYPEGLITGYFGPLTRSAVKRLQKKNGIEETGKADTVVRELLKNLPIAQSISEIDTKSIIKSFAHDLYFGMRNDEVRVIQEYLEKQGFLEKGFITGFFGLLTRQAVIDFQKSNNILPSVGYVGPLTRAKMLEDAEIIIGIRASELQIIADKLAVPWAIAFLPDSAILLTERNGNLVVLRDGAVKRIAVEGVYAIAEGGLLGMALHPDFDKNNFIYFYITYKEGDLVKNKIERYAFTNDTLIDKKIILKDIPGSSVHNGGRLAFGPDKYLYATTGYADNDAFAQDTSSLAGKILRMNDEGVALEDNPFQNLVYAYGFRNPQGLTWDNAGRLWATDHGRSGTLSGFDEVNLVEKGKNYGWPLTQENGALPNIEAPAITSGADVTWAPAGIVFVDDALFFGGLRGQALYQAQVHDDKVLYLKEYFSNRFGRIRVVAKDANGDIYFTTSNTDGRGNPNPDDDKLMKLNKAK